MKKSAEALFDKYRAQCDFVTPLEPVIRQAVDMLEHSYRNGGKLLVCGNGGSNADADHIVGELLKSFRMHRPLDSATQMAFGPSSLANRLEGSLPAINLGAHVSLVTAILNDVGADYIFAQQVIGYGHPGDILMGISTSGNSKNVLYAGEAARAKGMKTIALTGRDGGKMRENFDLTVCVDAQNTEDIQDAHSKIYHIICGVLECQFWGE